MKKNMAIVQDPSEQLNIEVVSVPNNRPRLQNQSESARQDLSTATRRSQLVETSCAEENTPLLGNTSSAQQARYFSMLKSKFKNQRCCFCSSKAVLIILTWNTMISFGLLTFLDPEFYTSVFSIDNYSISCIYAVNALILLFYPLAGCLADICWGRHKTVVNSLCFILWSFLSLFVVGSLFTIGLIPVMIYSPDVLQQIELSTIVILCTIFGIPILFGGILILCSLVAFSANVIQYGIDHLRDAPADDSVLYIHWYVWSVYLSFFILKLPESTFFILPYACPLAILFFAITLCIYERKRSLFHVDSGLQNPYKLVYKVLRFAKEHSNPIRRSAFTYCEDELPSRLDLGKEKYGGPFTTEEVENVKAFVGILCLLSTTGPTFLVDVEMNVLFSGGESYGYDNNFQGVYITPLIVIVVIPLYLGLLRPFIRNYIPGMLKRIGFGMLLFLISGLCTLVMGAFNTGCNRFISDYLPVNVNLLTIQSILNAFGYMLFYIASYELICAQSPHSMKGLLIGMFFAIKGVFQLLGVVAIYLPITYLCSQNINLKFPLCGFLYYLINLVVGLIGFIAFIFAARRYHYRVRDEADNIYRYAEEYYANTREEPNYDYDDYDNLRCETIIK